MLVQVRELSCASRGHAPPHTLQSLREGAAKVRAALQEFRAGDIKAKAKGDGGGGQGINKGEGIHEEQEQQEQKEQGGMEVLRLASCMASSPLSSQIMLASAVCTGQDALLSSWQFPYWKADFGGGGPIRYQGLVVPNPPWSASVMSAHPRHGVSDFQRHSMDVGARQPPIAHINTASYQMPCSDQFIYLSHCEEAHAARCTTPEIASAVQWGLALESPFASNILRAGWVYSCEQTKETFYQRTVAGAQIRCNVLFVLSIFVAKDKSRQGRVGKHEACWKCRPIYHPDEWNPEC
eukprot:1144962-Pelagomonas_calceolata.AAC.2